MNERDVNSPIRNARKTAGLRQQDVAEKLGVHVTSVSGWETGNFRPDPVQARGLMQIFPQLTFDDIYPPVGEAA